MKYEYKSVLIEVDRNGGFFVNAANENCCAEVEQQLNRLGQDGWELVGVFPITNGGSPAQISQALHHFKRPLG